ncbi:MAG: hypothetical protein OEM85_17870, partial [Gammaproteobacteria bacterium]|nr:hypothetical protein [Gammaproteobacteria bacterium]
AIRSSGDRTSAAWVGIARINAAQNNAGTLLLFVLGTRAIVATRPFEAGTMQTYSSPAARLND